LSVGEQAYLRDVQATFADGSTLDVENSTRHAYQSDSPSVATVDENGIVTAVAPGSASIAVSYGGLIFQVPVKVRQQVAILPKSRRLNASLTAEICVHTALRPGTTPDVKWSLRPALGSFVPEGDECIVYTAPESVAASTRVNVTATSLGDPTQSDFAEVLLLPPAVVRISPPAVSLSAGQSQEFSGTVSNSSGQWVDWVVAPRGVGTLSWRQVQDGDRRINHLTYTAPTAIKSSQTITVTASGGDTGQAKASVIVTLVP
jgi:hypothetical protein